MDKSNNEMETHPMKTIGLLGGTSWASTIDYYRLLNVGINAELGGLNFCRCIIHSFNYADIQRNNLAGDWDSTLAMFVAASEHLIRSGADAIMLCANTMHHVADRLQAAISVPLIHIADVTADAIAAQGLTRVALLGTRYTMEFAFFTDILKARGIAPIIPGEEDKAFIHNNIFEELCHGIVTPAVKMRYISLIEKLAAQGAQGVILGCTEIPLVIQQADVSIPIFDTTQLHAAAAVRFALGK
jgi:aspartate racemase